MAVTPLDSLGLYIHVPFCASRCGYCDFNTYTAGELGSSASPQSWLAAVDTELEMAAAELSSAERGSRRAVSTVFVGGGTPSMLGGQGLAELIDCVRRHFEIATGAEVTTESNPESTSPKFFDQLLAAGYTRISLGMQSIAPHVLRALDRTHTPGRAPAAALQARQAGFAHVNLDLIYGTPGETDDDVIASLEAAIGAQADHISAYALIVEDGTALARKVRHGEIPAPDDDVLADRYELLDARLEQAGLTWYEVSNWASARDPDARCRHNLAYWASTDWWGIGPGAHSHVGGVRWWNLKHPARYAESLSRRELPIAGKETLTDEDRHTEQVMLELRCRSGLSTKALDAGEYLSARKLVAAGLLIEEAGALVLTSRGRLLADAVVRRILVSDPQSVAGNRLSVM